MNNGDSALTASLQEVCYWYSNYDWSFGSRRAKFKPVLEDVTVSFPANSVSTILGLNGAGKSTLIKMLACVIHPKAGLIKFNDDQIINASNETKKKIGLAIGTRSRLIWDLPPVETFRLHKTIYSISESDYSKTLEEIYYYFDIENLILRPTRELSLGQRVRTEIALAMLHRPQLLLLDECSIGLDLLAKEKYHDAILHISKEWGTTVVQATNDLSDVRPNMQKVVILANSKIVFDGAYKELISLPSFSPTVKITWIGEGIEKLRGSLSCEGIKSRELDGESGSLLVFLGINNIDENRHKLLQLIASYSNNIKSIQFERESLKEVLKELETTHLSVKV